MNTFIILLFIIVALIYIIYKLKKIEPIQFDIDLQLQPKKTKTIYKKNIESYNECKSRLYNKCSKSRKKCRICKRIRRGKGAPARINCWISKKCLKRRMGNQICNHKGNGRRGWKKAKKSIRIFCNNPLNRKFYKTKHVLNKNANTKKLGTFALYDNKNNQVYKSDFKNKICDNPDIFTTYPFHNLNIPEGTILQSYKISVGDDALKLNNHNIHFRKKDGDYIYKSDNKGGGNINKNNDKSWNIKNDGLYIYPDSNGVAYNNSLNIY